MQIETERLVLRLPRLEDADGILDSVSDPEVMRWIGAEPGDRAAAVAAVERWLARWEADRVGHFAIERKGDGRVLGRAGFLVWDRSTWESSSYAAAADDAETELGWTLAREHWGHGYATEAARAVRDWAYEERDVERIISLIAPDNVRSIRVAVKLCATPEQMIQTHHGPTIVWVHPR
jgi:RimJ/RimL family protein N-acetyltransferase